MAIDCSVADIASPTKNALVGGPFGSDLVSKDYVPSGVPVIRGTNMGCGRWVGGDFAYVTKEKADSLSSNCAKPGDIIFTQRGTLGQVALVPPNGATRYLISQSQMKLTVDENKADPLFLYYVFTSVKQQEYIRQNAIQTGVPHTNLGILRRTPLSIPPLPEQKAIARILGTLDDKIELNRRMNATLEAMARALFQSWFVDFDPVRAKTAGRQPSGMNAATAALFPSSFQDSSIGEIPAGWNTTTLGSVLDTLETGRRPKGGVSGFTSGVPSIGAESIWGIGEFDFEKTKFVPTEFFEKMNSGKVQHLDVLLYKDGGKPGEFRPRVGLFGHHFPFEQFGINEHVFRLRSSSVGQLYLYFTVADPRVLLDFANKGGKAAIPGINQQDVRSTVILQPPSSILDRFNNDVSPLVDRILRNAKESRTLATLRNTLLPKLLSGELNTHPKGQFERS